MTKKPIGIFDSGVGGTSIWAAIVQALPFEDTLYLADSKHAPYGERSPEEIVGLSIKNSERLLALGCKIIVVACNTATTNAIQILRARFPIPIIGIEPAIKPAALQTKTKTIGILATKGTLSSALFAQTADRYANHLDIIEVEGKGLVPLIENNELDSVAMQTLLSSYINPMLEKNIDHLVLGCSHYPYLIPLLNKLLPSSVTIIDSGAAVARQTKNILNSHQLLNQTTKNGKHHFFTNTNTTVLRAILDQTRVTYHASYLNF